MSHSMVSPGFWCQAPKALVPHVGAKTKDVWFETTDRLCGTDATHFRVRTNEHSCTSTTARPHHRRIACLACLKHAQPSRGALELSVGVHGCSPDGHL